MPLGAAVTAEIAKGYSIPKITAAPLATPPDLGVALFYVLAGQLENARVLGEIVIQADQASIVPKLAGDPSKARTAPKQALQRKLLDSPRHLVRTDLKLNQRHGSGGWLTEDALRLVRKTACDKLGRTFCQQGIGRMLNRVSSMRQCETPVIR